MSRKSSKKTVSPETQIEADKLAKAIQRPGQSKEQTRLVSQGIQKGIELYKKQHKAKSRELDKRLKSIRAQPTQVEGAEVDSQQQQVYRQHWLPWTLLLITWLTAGYYIYTTG